MCIIYVREQLPWTSVTFHNMIPADGRRARQNVRILTGPVLLPIYSCSEHIYFDIEAQH